MDTRLYWPSLSSHHSRVTRRAFTGFALCFLAFVFALAAKVSWYHTDRGAQSDLSSMKAFRVDPPAVPAPALASFSSAATLPIVCLWMALLVVALPISAPGAVDPCRTQQPFRRRSIARPPPTR